MYLHLWSRNWAIDYSKIYSDWLLFGVFKVGLEVGARALKSRNYVSIRIACYSSQKQSCYKATSASPSLI